MTDVDGFRVGIDFEHVLGCDLEEIYETPLSFCGRTSRTRLTRPHFRLSERQAPGHEGDPRYKEIDLNIS